MLRPAQGGRRLTHPVGLEAAQLLRRLYEPLLSWLEEGQGTVCVLDAEGCCVEPPLPLPAA